MLGVPESTVVRGTIDSVRKHGLQHTLLSAQDIRKRYGDVFRVSDDEIGVLENEAGVLFPEKCIEAHLDQAAKHGAVMHFEEKFISWKEVEGGEGVLVTTNRAVYLTKKLVLAVGPWAPQMYGDVVRAQTGMSFECERRVLYWIDPLKSDTANALVATAVKSQALSRPLWERDFIAFWAVAALRWMTKWAVRLGISTPRWLLLTNSESIQCSRIEEQQQKIMDNLQVRST
jgi:hypothetical protein